MLKVEFYTVSKNDGKICDECGRFITHIVLINCDGAKFYVGEECYQNILKKTNLSEYGINYLKKSIAKIKKFRKEIELLKNRDRDGLKKINFFAPFHMRDGFDSKGDWIERPCETEEEFGTECDFWIERAERHIAEIEKDIEQKFKNIKIKGDCYVKA